MAITSAIKHFKKSTKGKSPHIVTTSVEHDATLEILKHLEENNEIDLAVVKPLNGNIGLNSVLNSITDTTCLITLMMANNETGVVFPVQGISESLEGINDQRATVNLPIIYLHVDAAQAIGKLPVQAKELKADYISVAGHKFYGPRIGALYIKEGAPVYPLLFGGGQESGLRPGTENTPMIAGLGEAAQLVTENLENYRTHMKNMRDLLQYELKKTFPADQLSFNFTDEERLPNTLSVSFLERNGRDILGACRRLVASTGSACHSSSLPISRVIRDCLDEKYWDGVVRLSVGRETTTSQIKAAVDDLYQAFIKTKETNVSA